MAFPKSGSSTDAGESATAAKTHWLWEEVAIPFCGEGELMLGHASLCVCVCVCPPYKYLMKKESTVCRVKCNLLLLQFSPKCLPHMQWQKCCK